MVKVRPLSDEERRNLRRLARREIGRVSERIHMVLLASRGYPVNRIAEIFECDEQTVVRWLERFNTEGVEGLRDRPRSGRPRKADAAARSEIIRLVDEAQPERYGLVLGFWTVASLCAYLARELALSLGESTVRRILRAAGFVWRRPRLTVRSSAADPEASVKQWAIAKAVVEAGPDAGVVYVDECDIQLLPVVRSMWMRRGQQVKVPTPGTNRKFSVFGALDIYSGVWHYRIAEGKSAVNFVGFLEQLAEAYKDRPLIVIADNAAIHLARVVGCWLGEHPQVRLLFLPKYCPHLNPVEKIWWQLKRQISANRCHGDIAYLAKAVHQFFGQLTPQAALRLAA